MLVHCQRDDCWCKLVFYLHSGAPLTLLSTLIDFQYHHHHQSALRSGPPDGSLDTDDAVVLTLALHCADPAITSVGGGSDA